MSRRLRRVTRLGFFLAAINLVLWFGSPSIRAMVDTFYGRLDHPDKPHIVRGIQEALVYLDPWYSWWVMPAVFIAGFALVPMLLRPEPVKDADAGGQSTIGFYAGLTTAVLFFFEVVYLFLLYVGVARRGPDWALYKISEEWKPKEIIQDQLNLSEFIWGSDAPSQWFMRELPGIVLLVIYFGIGLAIARWLAKKHPTMSRIKWAVYVCVFQVAAILPIKMLLRWTVNLKNIISCPWFNL